MLKKRIIPCLDVRDGVVVKGVQFQNHTVVGDIIELATYYSKSGADELVFYDITASSEGKSVAKEWVKNIAKAINIPFCVAGGIRSISDAELILANGADKISINSPAIENPNLIDELAKRFGSQCVVVGIDSFETNGIYQVKQYTGDINKTIITSRTMLEWALEVESRGAGEIVLNSMNKDGVRNGYDIKQNALLSKTVTIPVIASGGAGVMDDFYNLFSQTEVSGGLAASVFHKKIIEINSLKTYLFEKKIAVRLC